MNDAKYKTKDTKKKKKRKNSDGTKKEYMRVL